MNVCMCMRQGTVVLFTDTDNTTYFFATCCVIQSIPCTNRTICMNWRDVTQPTSRLLNITCKTALPDLNLLHSEHNNPVICDIECVCSCAFNTVESAR